MASQSPFSSIDIPDLNLWDFLFEGNRKYGYADDKILFQDAETYRQITFHNLKQEAASFGHALLTQWTWQQGDVVALYSPNCVDTPKVMFGILWAGGVLTPASPSYSASELAFQLKTSGSKALITQFSCLDIALEAARMAKIPTSRILLIGDAKSSAVAHVDEFVTSAPSDSKLERVTSAPGDLSLLVFSSGTTGLPKGVMLTHRNLVANIVMGETAYGELSYKGGLDDAGDIMIGVLPFYHIYGLMLLVVLPVYLGIKVVVMPRFEPASFCKAIQDHRVTFGPVVPPMVLFLSKSPLVDKYDLSSLRILISAAAPLTMDMVEAIWERLRIPVKQAYGLSETSPAIATQIKARTKIGSVGRILPNQHVKIMLESGSPALAGTTGEIWVKGPNVFAGYLNNSLATKETMTPDGYFKTGDVGYLDKDGHLYITDRLKEIIKYKGFQVAPAELEGILLRHEMVADACVMGIYDQHQATELPRAYIVKADAALNLDDAVLAAEIRTWVDGKIASYKHIRGGVHFVDTIPKSAAGKTLRRVLRASIDPTTLNNPATKSKL